MPAAEPVLPCLALDRAHHFHIVISILSILGQMLSFLLKSEMNFALYTFKKQI